MVFLSRRTIYCLGILLGTVCCVTFAQSSSKPAEAAQTDKGKTEGQVIFVQTVPVRPGVDRCIVCGTPLKAGDKCYLVEGQRVGIMEVMAPQLFGDPWTYIARLRPRGGLFGGEVAPQSTVSDAWLLLGIYVTMGLAFAAVCAHRAINTGQATVPWFLAGLFFNAFGYLALLLRAVDHDNAAQPQHSGVTKVPTTSEPQVCPDCGHLNHPSATECLGCHTALTPQRLSEVTRLTPEPNQT